VVDAKGEHTYKRCFGAKGRKKDRREYFVVKLVSLMKSGITPFYLKKKIY
jgi:hypothetical protein